jgi:uncharacterized protein with gpF-like domain
MPNIKNIETILSQKIQSDVAVTVLEIEQLVSSMRLYGMDEATIISTLETDLINQGRLFGAFRNRIKNTIKSAIMLASGAAQRNIYGNEGIKEFRWVTVSDTRVCPDCVIRHNRIETLDTFQLIGLPGSGFSICRGNCRCVMVPVSYKGEDLSKPLIRKRK